MNCINCGNQLTDGAKFCPRCGQQSVLQTEALNEIICPKCGKILHANAAFCNFCGHNLKGDPVSPNTKVCPKCGAVLKADAVFCGKCGSSLNSGNSCQMHSPKQKNNTGLIVLVILLIVAVIGSASVATYVWYQNTMQESESNDEEREDSNKGKKQKDDEYDEEMESYDEIEEDFPEETPEPEPEEEIYLFPSDRQYITDYDLYGKTKEEVALIRNEIYARHGYVFKTEPSKSYFESKDWYVPNPYFNDSLFSDIERANKDFIVEYEESRGWR